MCGIVGVWREQEAGTSIAAMVEQIAHRGPDGHGVKTFDGEKLQLGHTRLAIIETSELGAQPMSYMGEYHITFNGELYNYRELRKQLVDDGYEFTSHSDTEVLLAMYAKHGRDMLQHLNGVFAFALYDEGRNELFVARDHMGVKPLYFTEQGGFAFCSEMKALLPVESCRDLDSFAVLSHFTTIWSPHSHTIAKHVRKLSPGSALIVQNGRCIKRWQYYTVPTLASEQYTDPADTIATNLLAELDQAVERQMVSDVPVGAFLSGGLDSSSIVASAVKHSGPLPCYTIDIDTEAMSSDGFAADLPYAKRVADHLGCDLHVYKADESLAHDLEKMVYHLDEPTADFAALQTFAISEFARSQGVKVLLSGAGGDDIFTGYRRHRALGYEKYWGWLPRPMRLGLQTGARRLPVANAKLRRVAKAFSYAAESLDERVVTNFYWLDPAVAISLLDDGFAANLSNTSIRDVLFGTLESCSATDPLARMLYLECQHFLADHNLNYADKMSMAAGVEVRVPLIDIELVDFASKIPMSMRQRGAEGKWILKKAMESRLPNDVIYRPKTGFGVPLRTWLHGPLSQLLNDTLSSQSMAERGIFNIQALQELAKNDALGRIDASQTLFSALCIELWCARFVQSTSEPSISE